MDATVTTEEENMKHSSNPGVLIMIYCLKYALSRNAMIALLELLRLKLDVSEIQNVDQILNCVHSAPVSLQSTCRTCYADLDVEDCFDDF